MPGAMFAATAAAATEAASPMPNAVPVTALLALAMMADTSSAVCPKPRSFDSAWSMDCRRWKPEVTNAAPSAPAIPTPARAATPTALRSLPSSFVSKPFVSGSTRMSILPPATWAS